MVLLSTHNRFKRSALAEGTRFYFLDVLGNHDFYQPALLKAFFFQDFQVIVELHYLQMYCSAKCRHLNRANTFRHSKGFCVV